MALLATPSNLPISAALGDFLASLCRLQQPALILEIGTYHGFSTGVMAGACPNSHIVTLERDATNQEQARQKLSNYHNIEHILGDAAEILPSFSHTLKRKFDLIFIDANKAKYPLYLEYSLALLAEGGLIIADNTLFRGYVFAETFPPRFKKITTELRKFHAMLAADFQLEHITLPIEDGVTIIKRKTSGATRAV